MCEFCENFKAYKKYGVAIRNAYADDDLCQVLRNNNCEDCDGCTDEKFHFTLYRYHDMISFAYIQEIPECTIAQTSEHLKINYCPWCGQKMTDELVSFEECVKPFYVER